MIDGGNEVIRTFALTVFKDFALGPDLVQCPGYRD